MAENTIYLITGANRGVGKALLEALLLRPNTTVIAAVRDPAHPSSQSLCSLPTGSRSLLYTVKIDSLSATDAASAIETLRSQHGIIKLDIVIANAGIAKQAGPVAETPLSEMRDHFEINTLGPLVLFQATLPLLSVAAAPKFVAVSSDAGSLTKLPEFPVSLPAYSCSKAALNVLMRRIHAENEQLVAFSINPGWAQSDLGNLGAQYAGVGDAPVTLKDSAAGMLDVIDKSTRASSRVFWDYDGSVIPW